MTAPASKKAGGDLGSRGTTQAKKVIEELVHATGASEEDVQAMLQICNGDVNEAANRLVDSPFVEVKSKRTIRQERERSDGGRAVETRRTSAPPGGRGRGRGDGRGGRGGRGSASLERPGGRGYNSSSSNGVHASRSASGTRPAAQTATVESVPQSTVPPAAVAAQPTAAPTVQPVQQPVQMHAARPPGGSLADIVRGSPMKPSYAAAGAPQTRAPDTVAAPASPSGHVEEQVFSASAAYTSTETTQEITPAYAAQQTVPQPAAQSTTTAPNISAAPFQPAPQPQYDRSTADATYGNDAQYSHAAAAQKSPQRSYAATTTVPASQPVPNAWGSASKLTSPARSAYSAATEQPPAATSHAQTDISPPQPQYNYSQPHSQAQAAVDPTAHDMQDLSMQFQQDMTFGEHEGGQDDFGADFGTGFGHGFGGEDQSVYHAAYGYGAPEQPAAATHATNNASVSQSTAHQAYSTASPAKTVEQALPAMDTSMPYQSYGGFKPTVGPNSNLSHQHGTGSTISAPMTSAHDVPATASQYGGYYYGDQQAQQQQAAAPQVSKDTGVRASPYSAPQAQHGAPAPGVASGFGLQPPAQSAASKPVQPPQQPHASLPAPAQQPPQGSMLSQQPQHAPQQQSTASLAASQPTQRYGSQQSVTSTTAMSASSLEQAPSSTSLPSTAVPPLHYASPPGIPPGMQYGMQYNPYAQYYQPSYPVPYGTAAGGYSNTGAYNPSAGAYPQHGAYPGAPTSTAYGGHTDTKYPAAPAATTAAMHGSYGGAANYPGSAASYSSNVGGGSYMGFDEGSAASGGYNVTKDKDPYATAQSGGYQSQQMAPRDVPAAGANMYYGMQQSSGAQPYRPNTGYGYGAGGYNTGGYAGGSWHTQGQPGAHDNNASQNQQSRGYGGYGTSS